MSDTETDLREKLIHLLKRHDWFYEYSDDHAEWTWGNKQRTEILALLSKVPDGQELFNQYKPKQAV